MVATKGPMSLGQCDAPHARSLKAEAWSQKLEGIQIGSVQTNANLIRHTAVPAALLNSFKSYSI